MMNPGKNNNNNNNGIDDNVNDKLIIMMIIIQIKFISNYGKMMLGRLFYACSHFLGI